MSANWYYADRQQTQQGPVDAAWLQGAYGRGEVLSSSLVWREGMANWAPLSQVGHELGIAIAAVATPPLPTSAASPGVHAGATRPVIVKPSGGTPWLLILLILGGAMVLVLGILAAIAIPAYQDYTQRSRIGAAVFTGMPVRIQVEEFVRQNDACPVNGEGDIGAPESYANGVLQSLHAGTADDGSGRCAIELRLTGVNAPGDQHTLTMLRQDASQWLYRSDLDPRQLPAHIRTQLD